MPTESPKQQIIAYRQSKYGINETTGRTNLNSEVRSDLHNSIQNLSEGLYSKQSHFIFELIQNAEDNIYDKGAVPELVIELLADDPTNTLGCKGCLCIYNNELGFEFANIKAISSIGGSTKAKAKAKGYIGEKGIGFKSVFAVSPQPHIISNGYQICFKEKDEQAGLGYVIPYWLENIPSCAAKAGFNTVILLPLKQEEHQDVLARIGDELLQLKPETTLFLNKLQKLTLITPKRHASFSKTTKGAMTTLSRTENSETLVQHYWLQRLLVNVPQSLQEEKRAGVTKRDISLAFPIGHQLTSSPLFAYLPTEMETGLPFLINADFLLVASRESVRESLPWNAWLREQVAKFAADKLSGRLSTTRKFDEFAWIPHKLRCTNLFFEPIFQQIISELSQHPILPDRHGQRRLASHCRIDTGEDWFNVLSPTYPVDSQAQYLLEPQLANFWYLLEQLGAKQLDVVALCTLINHSDKARKQNAAWFLTLYQWLQRHWPQTDDRNERAIAVCSPLIKTSQSNVVSGNCLIYEPSNKRISFPQLVDSEGYQADYYLLDNKLRSLLLADTACREFIKDILNIKSLTPTEFVKQVALPFTKKRIASLSDTTLWQLTEFIFKHWWDFSDELKSDFSKAFPIKLSSGGWYYRNKNLQVVTPAKWSGSEIWQTIFAE
ncbi:hypothetical protein MSG37_10570 [Shewanella sp. 1CM18E]|uniref:sacsin N-terminal ATP-binding-like domain-containing protein n=1 Tax=Shewanella sp. 1CM18E TaxID=2929169 RepID=UPI0020BF475D|nr:hypothetical protein [Shewanella sp. 1CM18E]MCK8045334.1 hypothetical protein [Shewanella sp. 1CM18E]